MLHDKDSVIFREESHLDEGDNKHGEIISFVLGVISFLILVFFIPLFSAPLAVIGLYYGVRSKSNLNIALNAIILLSFIVVMITL